MNRVLLYISLAGGVFLSLCSLAHSTGWSAQFAGAVTEAGLAPDLVAGLQVGWYFGSFCMAGFGLVVSFLAFVFIIPGAMIAAMAFVRPLGR